MASIKTNAGAVLACTDDVEAAGKDMSLVTFDRAHALVTGGHAGWIEPPEEPQAAAPVTDPRDEEIAALKGQLAQAQAQVSVAVLTLEARDRWIEELKTALDERDHKLADLEQKLAEATQLAKDAADAASAASQSAEQTQKAGEQQHS